MRKEKDDTIIRSFETDPERKSQAVEDLKTRLQTDTQGQGRIARVSWLMSHLAEYLDRWTTIIVVYSMSDYIHNDLHVVLTMAVDLIDEEMRDLPNRDEFKARWAEFASTVKRIDSNTSKHIAEELTAKFEAARKELC